MNFLGQCFQKYRKSITDRQTAAIENITMLYVWVVNIGACIVYTDKIWFVPQM